MQVAGANLQLAFSSQSPVTALPPSEAGFHDVFGSAWEWAEDHFAPLPGFAVHQYYPDFSEPCFAGLHQLVSSSRGRSRSDGELSGRASPVAATAPLLTR